MQYIFNEEYKELLREIKDDIKRELYHIHDENTQCIKDVNSPQIGTMIKCNSNQNPNGYFFFIWMDEMITKFICKCKETSTGKIILKEENQVGEGRTT